MFGRIAVWSIFLPPMVALAQVVPLGDDFQVNSYTTDSQTEPVVAVASDDSFVVVWQGEGSYGTDTSGLSVQGQRFAADGSPLGGEFQVNSYTSGNQGIPAVAFNASGDFLVVWESDGSGGTDTGEYSIQGQRFAADGTPLGEEFQVNTLTLAAQRDPAVAAGAGGGFVVVWQSEDSSGTDSSSYSVQVRLLAADGTPLGDEFQVNTYTHGAQFRAGIGAAAAGGFVVVWQSNYPSFEIYGRRFAVDGTPLGEDFRVNSSIVWDKLRPSVACGPGGGFLASWDGSVQGSGIDAQARGFDSDGAPVGDDFVVNTYSTSYQRHTAVASDFTGNFIVTWNSAGSSGTDSSGLSVQGQRFDTQLAPLGVEFQVNTYTTADQAHPAVAASSFGGFVVVWQDGNVNFDGQDGSARGIFGRRFGNLPFFADGFESGDTSAWPGAVP